MKSDEEIQQDVQAELHWQPFIKSSEIGVAVKNGIVTLTGTVDAYSKKESAENAAMKVLGVKGIANDIDVKLSGDFRRSDSDVAEAVLNAIKWNSSIDENKIKVLVENGWVTLEGKVDWEYQKSRARNLAIDLNGVAGVTNLITVASKSPTYKELKDQVSAAITRSVNIFNGKKINVFVNGNKVTLVGKVRSLREKMDAETAAWSAPGITEVENDLEVSYAEAVIDHNF
jgi:osmotically-inducible protein OsmY